MRNRFFVLAVAAGALTLAGCGSRSATVPTANGAATVEQNGNMMTVTTPQGTAQITTGGTGAALPGNLPPYPNAVPGADIAGSSAGQQGRVVTFTTSDQPGQVRAGGGGTDAGQFGQLAGGQVALYQIVDYQGPVG